MKINIVIPFILAIFPMVGTCDPLPSVSVYFNQYRAGKITIENVEDMCLMRESVLEMHRLKDVGLKKLEGKKP